MNSNSTESLTQKWAVVTDEHGDAHLVATWVCA